MVDVSPPNSAEPEVDVDQAGWSGRVELEAMGLFPQTWTQWQLETYLQNNDQRVVAVYPEREAFLKPKRTTAGGDILGELLGGGGVSVSGERGSSRQEIASGDEDGRKGNKHKQPGFRGAEKVQEEVSEAGTVNHLFKEAPFETALMKPLTMEDVQPDINVLDSEDLDAESADHSRRPHTTSPHSHQRTNISSHSTATTRRDRSPPPPRTIVPPSPTSTDFSFATCEQSGTCFRVSEPELAFSAAAARTLRRAQLFPAPDGRPKLLLLGTDPAPSLPRSDEPSLRHSSEERLARAFPELRLLSSQFLIEYRNVHGFLLLVPALQWADAVGILGGVPARPSGTGPGGRRFSYSGGAFTKRTVLPGGEKNPREDSKTHAFRNEDEVGDGIFSAPDLAELRGLAYSMGPIPVVELAQRNDVTVAEELRKTPDATVGSDALLGDSSKGASDAASLLDPLVDANRTISPTALARAIEQERAQLRRHPMDIRLPCIDGHEPYRWWITVLSGVSGRGDTDGKSGSNYLSSQQAKKVAELRKEYAELPVLASEFNGGRTCAVGAGVER